MLIWTWNPLTICTRRRGIVIAVNMWASFNNSYLIYVETIPIHYDIAISDIHYIVMLLWSYSCHTLSHKVMLLSETHCSDAGRLAGDTLPSPPPQCAVLCVTCLARCGWSHDQDGSHHEIILLESFVITLGLPQCPPITTASVSSRQTEKQRPGDNVSGIISTP